MSAATVDLAVHVRPEDFRHRAACRSVDPELFYPTAEDGPQYDDQVVAAKAVCVGCPVLAECLEWALVELPYGVAGAMTEQERRAERARRRGSRGRATRPTVSACGSSREVAAAGRAAIGAGMSPREAAREFGVSERTAVRWAAEARTTSNSTRGGESGSHRAPLQISHANPQVGTRAEGHRG